MRLRFASRAVAAGVILAGMALLGIASACSTGPAQPPAGGNSDDDDDDDDGGGGGGNNGTGTGLGDGGQILTNNPCAPASTATATSTGTGLPLTTQTTTYYADVKPMIDSKCVTCHKSGGTGTGDLSTYAAIVAAATKITTRLNDSVKPMPPATSPQFSVEEEQKLTAWLAAGAPEKAAATTPTANPCGTATSTGSATTDSGLLDEALNPPELAACHAQNKLYHRQEKRCHEATLDKTYNCDHAGVLGAFNNLAAAKTELDKKVAEKWSFDQCGRLNSFPYVLFLCLHKGDEVCIARAEADKLNEVHIKVGWLGAGP